MSQPVNILLSFVHYEDIIGQTISPNSINGVKMEYFIFDSFFLASHVAGLEVERESDFSPVKNADGM